MRWLRSTDTNRYTIAGKTIPAFNEEPIQLAEAEYNKIASNPAIKSLLNSGSLIVLNKYVSKNQPDVNATKLQALTKENAQLQAKLAKLEAKSGVDEQTKADAEAIKKELEEWKSKYAALEQEANEKIAELSEKKK